MPRYKQNRIVVNDVDFYDFLREKRNIKKIRHYTTPVLNNPSFAERASLQTTTHVWGYGDRYYKLAYRFYGNQDYWWVIAWWNGRPTEADVDNGDVIYIPINLQNALKVLGAY